MFLMLPKKMTLTIDAMKDIKLTKHSIKDIEFEVKMKDINLANNIVKDIESMKDKVRI